MRDAPLMVLAEMTELLSVLLVKVAGPASVTTTPDVGKVAVEFTPVPPAVVAKVPVTAADCDRSRAPKDGVPPPAGTRKLW